MNLNKVGYYQTYSKEFFDKEAWERVMTGIEYNVFGGLLMVDDEFKESYYFMVFYGRLPLAMFTDEITDNHNGSFGYHYLEIISSGSDYNLPNEVEENIVQRMISYLTYNDRGDIVDVQYKKPLGHTKVVVLKFRL